MRGTNWKFLIYVKFSISYIENRNDEKNNFYEKVGKGMLHVWAVLQNLNNKLPVGILALFTKMTRLEKTMMIITISYINHDSETFHSRIIKWKKPNDPSNISQYAKLRAAGAPNLSTDYFEHAILKTVLKQNKHINLICTKRAHIS